MTYKEYTEARQKEVNDLPLFFAFSNEQLDRALAERNATYKDIYRLGDTGGFYLKKDAEIIRAVLGKGEIYKLMQDHDFAVDAFYYEMCNHEYGINWQADWDVCSVFTHREPEYDEEKTYVEYLTEDGQEHLIPAYREAKQKYFDKARECEWI